MGKFLLRWAWAKCVNLLVPQEGIEPPTHALRMRCSTPELLRLSPFSFKALVLSPLERGDLDGPIAKGSMRMQKRS
jgi:hypothetical protein